MKYTRLLSFLLALSVTFLFSCNRDKETEDISRITFFPDFTMEGDAFQSLVVGDTYTEEGVTATEQGEPITVTTSGTVDTSTPGIYTIRYSATNVDGFSGSVTRTVAVLPVAETPGVDLSGKYANVGGNPANGSDKLESTVIKLAPGFYRASNIWGGTSLAIIPAYFLSPDGTDLTFPVSTLSPYGRATGTGTLDASGLMTLSISLLDQGLSNSTRRWQRQ